MFPIIIFAGLAGLIAWAVKPKTTGIIGPGMGQDDPQDTLDAPSMTPMITGGRLLMLPAIAANATAAPPPILRPEQERLLSLLVLFARDKKYPAGQKKYLTAPMALETVTLARRLSLPRTAQAIRSDGPIPDDEHIAGRSESVRALTLKYGTTGKA
jgi:hypothetical protein